MADTKKLELHNEYQRQYYERRTLAANHRMVPGAGLDCSPYIAAHLDRLIAFARLTAREKIIDVGCGMGKYTIPMARAGFQVEGLDLSPVLLAALQDHCTGGVVVPTHCEDILKPPPALFGCYDVVMGSFMLHHLQELLQAFRQMACLLKAGGKAVFIDVNPLCLLYYLQITFSPSMRWAAEKGLFALTRRNVHKTLQAAGFANIRMQRFGIAPPCVRNGRWGSRIESVFESMTCLNSVAAFQLVYAEKP